MPSVGTLSPRMKFYQGTGRAKSRKDYKNLINNKLKSDVKFMQKQKNLHNNESNKKAQDMVKLKASNLTGIYGTNHDDNGEGLSETAKELENNRKFQVNIKNLTQK